jgi:hypothetical protein
MSLPTAAQLQGSTQKGINKKCVDEEYSVFQESYCTLISKSYCAKRCAEDKCVK